MIICFLLCHLIFPFFASRLYTSFPEGGMMFLSFLLLIFLFFVSFYYSFSFLLLIILASSLLLSFFFFPSLPSYYCSLLLLLLFFLFLRACQDAKQIGRLCICQVHFPFSPLASNPFRIRFRSAVYNRLEASVQITRSCHVVCLRRLWIGWRGRELWPRRAFLKTLGGKRKGVTRVNCRGGREEANGRVGREGACGEGGGRVGTGKVEWACGSITCCGSLEEK